MNRRDPSDVKQSRSLHRSTWAVAVVVVALLLLANVPGEPSEEFYAHHEVLGGGRWNAATLVEHGWPLTYLTRRPPWPDQRPPSMWPLTDRVANLHSLFLVADAVVALLVLIPVCGLFEWRIRSGKLFQFGLRSLAIAVAALAGLFAWYVHEKRVEERLVKCVDGLDGYSPFSRELEPQLPMWVQRLIGYDRLDWYPLKRVGDYECDLPDTPEQVSYLRFLLKHYPAQVRLTIHERKTDSQLAYLRELDGVRWLEIFDADDRSLRYIGDLTSLQWLAVHGSSDDDGEHLTNGGLTPLRRLNKLKSLFFGYFYLDDSGVEHLQDLCRLEVFGADYCRLTDKAFNNLKNLRRLRVLELSGPSITDDRLAQIPELSGLERLRLGRTRVTDAGLVHLGSLTELSELDLSDNDLGDQGVSALGALSNLESLNLAGTRVESLDIRDRGAFPKLRWLGIRATNVTDSRVSLIRNARPYLIIDR